MAAGLRQCCVRDQPQPADHYPGLGAAHRRKRTSAAGLAIRRSPRFGGDRKHPDLGREAALEAALVARVRPASLSSAPIRAPMACRVGCSRINWPSDCDLLLRSAFGACQVPSSTPSSAAKKNGWPEGAGQSPGPQVKTSRPTSVLKAQ